MTRKIHIGIPSVVIFASIYAAFVVISVVSTTITTLVKFPAQSSIPRRVYLRILNPLRSSQLFLDFDSHVFRC